MKLLDPKDQTGTSLVEMVIAMGLLVLLGGLTNKYFQSQERSAMDDRARTNQMNEISVWLEIIARDMKLRPHPKPPAKILPIVPSFSRDINIERITQLKSGGEGLMIAHYYTYCQQLQPEVKAKYGDALDFTPTGLIKRFGVGHPYRCMAYAGCKSGEYPQIVMTLKNFGDKVLPSYPNGHMGYDGKFRGVFPQLEKELYDGGTMKHVSTSDRVVAAAVCMEPAPNESDRVLFETATLFEETSLRFGRKEATIPRENMAKLQVLPLPDK